MDVAIDEALKDFSSLPTVEDLVAVYDRLPEANACVLTLLLLLSASYVNSNCKQKANILSLVFDNIFPVYFKKVSNEMSNSAPVIMMLIP